MSGAAGAAASVTTWVMLLLNNTPVGSPAKVHGVTHSSDVDDVRALVKDAFSEDLVGIGRAHIQSVDRVRALVKDAFPNDLGGVDRAHIQLFLSSKAGVKASPPERIGDALAPDETLLSEVLSRLNPTGAGAGASFPDPLYLLAVAEGV